MNRGEVHEKDWLNEPLFKGWMNWSKIREKHMYLLHGSIYNNFVVHKKVVYWGLTVLNKIKFLKGKETRAESTKSSGKNMKKTK